MSKSTNKDVDYVTDESKTNTKKYKFNHLAFQSVLINYLRQKHLNVMRRRQKRIIQLMRMYVSSSFLEHINAQSNCHTYCNRQVLFQSVSIVILFRLLLEVGLTTRPRKRLAYNIIIYFNSRMCMRASTWTHFPENKKVHQRRPHSISNQKIVSFKMVQKLNFVTTTIENPISPRNS